MARFTWTSKQTRGVSFGAIMLASSAMNNLFVTYYLDLFMNVVELSPFYFYIGQVVFMLWNAINDPLFGWLSDTMNTTFLSRNPVQRRLAIIKYIGILWGIAFLLIWFPPSTRPMIAGLHFAFVLCFYDGMLTMVEVNHSAILAEITTSNAERATFNAFSGVFAGLGSLTSFVGHAYWDKHDLLNFRLLCLFVALASACIFITSANTLRAGSSLGVEERFAEKPHERKRSREDNGVLSKEGTSLSVMQFLRQLSRQGNLMTFIVIYFIQGFDCTFEKNHFSLFFEKLVGDAVSKHVQGLVISASFLLPWICTVILTPVIQRIGLYPVMSALFFCRVALCMASMLVVSSLGPHFVSTFLLVNRVMSECVCRLCPLIVSNLVDEDNYLHQRETPMSATIIGASTVLGKGAQSIAPMLGYWIFKHKAGVDGGVATDEFSQDSMGFFRFSLVAIPLCCVVAQTLLWRHKFTLKGAYLKKVKEHNRKTTSPV